MSFQGLADVELESGSDIFCDDDLLLDEVKSNFDFQSLVSVR